MNNLLKEIKDLILNENYLITYKGKEYLMKLTSLCNEGEEIIASFTNQVSYQYDPMAVLILSSNHPNVRDKTVSIKEAPNTLSNNLTDALGTSSELEQLVAPRGSYLSLSSELHTFGESNNYIFGSFGGRAIPRKKLFIGRQVYFNHGPSTLLGTILRKYNNGDTIVQYILEDSEVVVLVQDSCKFYRKKKHALRAMTHKLWLLGKTSKYLSLLHDSMNDWVLGSTEVPISCLQKLDITQNGGYEDLSEQLPSFGNKLHDIKEPEAIQEMTQQPCDKKIGACFLKSDSTEVSPLVDKGRGFKQPYVDDVCLAEVFISKSLKGSDKDVY